MLDHSPADLTCGLPSFSQQALDILGEIGIKLSDLLDDFDCSIHHWFPIVDLDQLRIEAQAPQGCRTTQSTPLLWLAILLVTTRPCSHTTHLSCRRLHATLLSISAALQTLKTPDIGLVQAQALIALYECGQGMGSQAYLTLSSAVAMATLIVAGNETNDKSLHWKVALMILDR